MYFRISATAFLFDEDKVLLLKRSMDKEIAPGLWSGIGGHAEPFELNNPMATCYREVYEETGIEEQDLKGLSLRYITLRKCESNNEIRLSYFYFGNTDHHDDVRDTNEGELFWVKKDNVLDLKMPGTIRKVVKHYLTEGYLNSKIFVGVMTQSESGILNWTVLGDYENLKAVTILG